jgi:hypothetical protein
MPNSLQSTNQSAIAIQIISSSLARTSADLANQLFPRPTKRKGRPGGRPS